MTLRSDQVLPFLLTLMEQKDYTIVEDESGVHMVMPKGSIQATLSGGRGILSPTKVIRTPGIKPSAMTALISGLIGGKTGGGAGGGGSSIQYLDELGVIVITDTPRNTRLVEEAVQTVLAERADQKFQRFEIQNVAASSARDRIIELLGSTAPRTGAAPAAGQGNQAAAAAVAGGSFTQSSGAAERRSGRQTPFFFRGREDEARLLGDLLTIVDVPITLVFKFYPVEMARPSRQKALASSLAMSPPLNRPSRRGATAQTGPAARPGQANQPRWCAAEFFLRQRVRDLSRRRRVYLSRHRGPARPSRFAGP